jgi:hypothetical protein
MLENLKYYDELISGMHSPVSNLVREDSIINLKKINSPEGFEALTQVILEKPNTDAALHDFYVFLYSAFMFKKIAPEIAKTASFTIVEEVKRRVELQKAFKLLY